MSRQIQSVVRTQLRELELWQQRWIAARTAMRVFPAIGIGNHFPFWTKPTEAVAAIARVPWFIALEGLTIVDDSNDRDSVGIAATSADDIGIVDAAADAAAGVAYAVLAASTPSDSTYAISEAADSAYAATSIMRSHNEFSDITFVNKLDISSPRNIQNQAYDAALTDINHVMTELPRQYENCNWNDWRTFFCRPFWAPITPWPDGWGNVVARFRSTANRIGLEELADQYEEHCRTGADFEKIQRWLFGEVRIPLHSEDCIELPESDAWWMLLLYRMGLEDRGRLNVLVQPRMNDVVTALADCVRSLTAEPDEARSKSTKRAAKVHRSKAATREATTRLPRRQEVVDVASRLEKQYGHLSPPPLWTAWFQAVHGDELRKIRRHFVKEAR